MSLFLYPYMLLAGALTTALTAALLYLSEKRKRRLTAELFSENVLKEIASPSARVLKNIKEAALLLSVFFLFAALARPQWGVERVELDTQTSYLVIAVDVSSSMKAMDIAPSRIENAKTMLKILTDSLKNVRTGIVAFTSQAYTQTPITSDAEAIKFFINGLRADMLRAPGTSVGAAVTRGVEMLSRYPGKKALVLLTDGEDHDPEEIKSSAQFASDNNVKIIAVGIGSPEGELIPDVILDGKVAEYKKDRQGKTVVTKLNETPLLELAEATGGVYIRYKSFQSAAEAVREAMEDLDKQTRALTARQGYKDRYQIPLTISLIFLLAAIFAPLKKLEFK